MAWTDWARLIKEWLGIQAYMRMMGTPNDPGL